MVMEGQETPGYRWRMSGRRSASTRMGMNRLRMIDTTSGRVSTSLTKCTASRFHCTDTTSRIGRFRAWARRKAALANGYQSMPLWLCALLVLPAPPASDGVVPLLADPASSCFPAPEPPCEDGATAPKPDAASRGPSVGEEAS